MFAYFDHGQTPSPVWQAVATSFFSASFWSFISRFVDTIVHHGRLALVEILHREMHMHMAAAAA
jgi:hypothetical protein